MSRLPSRSFSATSFRAIGRVAAQQSASVGGVRSIPPHQLDDLRDQPGDLGRKIEPAGDLCGWTPRITTSRGARPSRSAAGAYRPS